MTWYVNALVNGVPLWRQTDCYRWIFTQRSIIFIPPLLRRWNRGILDSPRCPSVRPSVDKVSGTFWKNYRLSSFHTWHLTPIHFRVPNLIFGPLVAKYLAEMGFPELFFRKLFAQFISYLALALMGWISWLLYIFVFLASFSALWWPNIRPEMGFPELFEKTIG